MGAGNQTVHRFRYALVYDYSTFHRKLSSRTPTKSSISPPFSNRKIFTHRRGEHRSPEPPLSEEVPDRAEESLVPLEKGDVTVGDRGIRRGRCPHRPPLQPKTNCTTPQKKSGLPLDKPEKIVYHKNRKSIPVDGCSHV